MLLSAALLLALPAAAAAAAGGAGWFGLHHDRDAELRAKAAAAGGPCSEHLPVQFFQPSDVTWWSGRTHGDEVCAKLGKPACTSVLDWQGHSHKCSETCEGARMAFCGKPPPARCMLCDGQCGQCPEPPANPKKGDPPNWQGCNTELAKSMPYCDASKSIDERVDWLVDNMTLAEKIRAISPQPALGETCGVHTCGKPSIGLPNYFWLTETNTAVAATCYTGDPSDPYHCATTFVGPMNMGASFNRTSWEMKGDVIGTEMRAFNNLAWMRQNKADLIGLTGFGPNINIARDPRFGYEQQLSLPA